MEGTTESTTSAPVETPDVSAPVAVERPTSAQDALTQAAASLESEAAARQETAATGQAAPPDPKSATHPSAEKKGPIPFDVHHTALENARTKARDETLAEWRQQHGWAEQVDRAAVQEAARLGQLYSQDRAGYVRQLLTEAVLDPTLAPVVRSEAARILGQRQTKEPDLSPDIPVVDDHGNVVSQTLSHERIQARIDAGIAKALSTLGERFDPLLKDREARQATEQAAEQERQIDAWRDDVYSEAVDTLPHFKEYEAEIAKAMEAIPGDPAKALRKAWAQVVGPQLEAKATSKALDSFKHKAAAQTVDGSGKAASTPSRPRNEQELAAYMASLS